jgi:hypothetical protein
MKSYIWFLIIFSSVSFVNGTPQSPEILIYESDTLFINYMPLEDLKYENDSIEARLSRLFEPMESTHWRGYTATWKVYNDSLFLIKVCDATNNQFVSLNKIFNENMLSSKGVFASWYTKKITGDFGEFLGINLKYDVPLYTGKFSFIINKGIIVDVKKNYMLTSVIDSIRSELKNYQDTMTYSLVDKYPVLITEERNYNYDELCAFVHENLQYSQFGKDQEAYAKIIIDKDGSVVERSLRIKIHPKLDKEALRILSLMKKWEPGVRNGKKVKTAIFITIPCGIDKHQ